MTIIWDIIQKRPDIFKIDSSKLGDYLRCARLFFFSHILAWRSKVPNNDLVFGSAAHVAFRRLLTHGYTKENCKVAFDLFKKEYRKSFPEDSDELYSPKIPAAFRHVLTKYTIQYANEDSKYHVVHTEIPGEIIIGNITLFFIMDAVLRDGENVFIMDHKTGSDWKYWNLWDSSLQMNLYLIASHSLFKTNSLIVNGVLFNKRANRAWTEIIEKDATSCKIPFTFNRVTVSSNAVKRYVWAKEIITHVETLQKDFEKLENTSIDDLTMTAFPRRYDCTKYFRQCIFYPFCFGNIGNPLQIAEYPPPGLHVDPWDPTEGHWEVERIEV